MLDPAGHYDGLRAWLAAWSDSGYVSQAAMDRLVVVDDVDAAIAACAPAETPRRYAGGGELAAICSSANRG